MHDHSDKFIISSRCHLFLLEIFTFAYTVKTLTLYLQQSLLQTELGLCGKKLLESGNT